MPNSTLIDRFEGKVTIVRTVAIAVCLSLAFLAQADRLIHIPTGKKVPNHVFRLEGGFEQGDLDAWHGYLDVGLTPDLDATFRTDDVPGSARHATLDVSYNYVAPIPNASPGLSVGIQDVAGNTSDGRRFYFATTFRVGLAGSADTFTPAEVTLGAYAGKKSSGFLGVMMPLTTGFRLLAEDDGYRVDSGIELRPVQNLSVKYLFIGSKPQLAAQVQSKF